MKSSSFFLSLVVVKVVCCYLFLFISTSYCFNVTKVLNENYLISLDAIEINEELESNSQIANLTRLVSDKLKSLNVSAVAVSGNKLKFYQNQQFNEQHEYFKLDQMQQQTNAAASSLLLRTNAGKRIDREYFCRAGGYCACESECRVYIHFMMEQRKNSHILFKLPIIINDINDNEPAFYQEKIFIDIDLDQSPEDDLLLALNEKDQQKAGRTDVAESSSDDDLIKIPLKLGYDLDSTAKNRIQGYELFHIRKEEENSLKFPGDNGSGGDDYGLKMIFIKYEKYDETARLSSDPIDSIAKSQGGQLNIFMNKSESFKDLIRSKLMMTTKNNRTVGQDDIDSQQPQQLSLIERFRLKANDPTFETYQEILINFKVLYKATTDLLPKKEQMQQSQFDSDLNVKVSSSFLFEKNFYNLTYLNFFDDDGISSSNTKIKLPTFKVNLKSLEEIESKGCSLDTLKYEIVSTDFDPSIFFIEKSANQNSKENKLSLKLLKFNENSFYQFKLIAMCHNQFSSQEDRQAAMLRDTALIMCQSRNVDLNDFVRVSVVSAVNGLDVRSDAGTHLFEFSFSNLTSLFKLINSSSASSNQTATTNLTLGYLIANVDTFLLKTRYLQYSNEKQLPSFKINMEMKAFDDYKYLSLGIFKFDELRNGLFAIRLNAKKFEKFIRFILLDDSTSTTSKTMNNSAANAADADLNFKFDITMSLKKTATINGTEGDGAALMKQSAKENNNYFSTISMTKRVNIRVPMKLIQQSYAKPLLTTGDLAFNSFPESAAGAGGISSIFASTFTLVSSSTNNTPQSPSSSVFFNAFNMFNSVLIVTTASVMLILFGLVCCVVSLSIYVSSRCKASKRRNNSNGADSSSKSSTNIIKTDNSLIIGDCDSERNYSSGQQPSPPSSTGINMNNENNQGFFYTNPNFVNSNSLSVSSGTTANNSMNGGADSYSEQHYLRPTKYNLNNNHTAHSYSLHITKQEEIRAEIASISGRLNNNIINSNSNSSSSSSSSTSRSSGGDSNSAIMVYDIMPSSSNKSTVATAAVSLIGINHHNQLLSMTTTTASSASNNVSPAATATTYADEASSVKQQQQQHQITTINSKSTSSSMSSSSPPSSISSSASKQHLSAYDWFLQAAQANYIHNNNSQQQSQESMLAIREERPYENATIADEETQQQKQQQQLRSQASLTNNDYRNEIYRNSQIIFKNSAAAGVLTQQQLESLKIAKKYKNTHPLSGTHLPPPAAFNTASYLKVQTSTAIAASNHPKIAAAGDDDEEASSTNSRNNVEFISPSSSSAISSISSAAVIANNNNTNNNNSSNSNNNNNNKNTNGEDLNFYEAKPIRINQLVNHFNAEYQTGKYRLNSNNNNKAATNSRQQQQHHDEDDEIHKYKNELIDLKNSVKSTIKASSSSSSKSPTNSSSNDSTTSSSSSGYSGSMKNAANGDSQMIAKTTKTTSIVNENNKQNNNNNLVVDDSLKISQIMNNSGQITCV